MNFRRWWCELFHEQDWLYVGTVDDPVEKYDFAIVSPNISGCYEHSPIVLWTDYHPAYLKMMADNSLRWCPTCKILR